MSAAMLKSALRQGCTALGLVLDLTQIERLLAYLGLLQQWNKVYNLTAVRTPEDMLTHHLLDCLAVLPALERHAAGLEVQRLQLLDVGAGAGLPGVVLAICHSDWTVTCVDAVAKKTAFIQHVAGTLQLPNLQAQHARVETLQRRYDVLIARAFASLQEFCTGSDHLLTEQGVWLAMKGKYPAAEIAALPPDVAMFHVEQLQIPGLQAERCLVWLRPQRR